MKIKHAIVTGGSSGIGKAVAVRLASRGANVTIVARRKELLRCACIEIEAARVSDNQVVLDLSADVADCAAVERAVAVAVKKSGPCDLLVTSAGIARPGYFMELPIDIFERTMAVNYLGCLYAVRTVLPVMRAQGGGHIAVVASGAGIVGFLGYSAYSPSKFALRGLAEALRSELKREGIGVSIVFPPDTETPQLVEENKTKPKETKAITGKAKTWSAAAVAGCIIEGIDKGRFAVTPGWEMTWLYRLHSIFLPLLHRYFDRTVRLVGERDYLSGRWNGKGESQDGRLE